MSGGSPVRVRLFAAARDAAGAAELGADPQRLDDLLAALRAELGPGFTAVLSTARVWVNGDDPPDGDATLLVAGDEVAVLPPVSGGAGRPDRPRPARATRPRGARRRPR
ncbi:MAG TPA: MoaD/ThiS family protein [Acidimicrobiia bacterium]